MATRNQSELKDRLNAEWTTPVKNILFPIGRNSNVHHQLRVNWYSTRVPLNCSKVSQGIIGILTILVFSFLAASFMKKVEGNVSWEISRSMVGECFQRYWPYRVTMKCCLRLSFILVVMTHHSSNHLGDRFWQGPSIRRIGRNNFPHPLGRRNVFLRETGRMDRRNADGVRTSLLVSSMTWNMGRTSLLDASIRLSQARLSSFCFSKFTE